MIEIKWSVTAFANLESLPQEVAFEILDLTDRLLSFPEIGTPLGSVYPHRRNCRQLVFKRFYRVFYLYEPEEKLVKILALQHCRQQLPTSADLHRAFKENDIEE
jgi:plasmid stabilization system protein ParE